MRSYAKYADIDIDTDIEIDIDIENEKNLTQEGKKGKCERGEGKPVKATAEFLQKIKKNIHQKQ